MNRGKVAIVAILVMGFSLALFAVVYKSWRSARAVEFWGRDTSELMIANQRIELLVLDAQAAASASSAPEDQRVKFANASYPITDRLDVTTARGMLHLPRALLENSSFQFDANPPASPSWAYALKFSKDDRSATILVNPQKQTVGCGSRVALLTKDIAGAIQDVIDDATRPNPSQP